MKKRLFPLLFSVLVLLPLTWSCDPYDTVDYSGVADEGYEGFKSDAELFLEFAYRKQSIVLNFLNYTSEGFTKEPFKGEVSKEDFDKFFFEIEEFNKNAWKYETAVRNIQQSNVLLNPTKARVNSGISDFFIWALGTGKRNRERIVTVASNLSPADRSRLYKDLRKEFKDKANNENDFWNKLQKGDFDSSAGQIYNEFYHNAETDFPYLAIDKNLTPGKIVVEEGVEGIDKGAAVIMDAASDLLPGFSIGKAIVTVADNTEKMAKSKTWKEALEHGFMSITEVMGEMGGVFATTKKIGETVKNVYEVMDHFDFIKKGKEEEKGKVVVKDKNTKEPAKIIIATRTDTDSDDDLRSSIYVSVKENVSKGLDLIMKAGTWMITTISENGKRETTEVKVKKGEILGVTINTGGETEDESTAGEIAITFMAMINAQYNYSMTPEMMNFGIPANTKLSGKGTKYSGTANEEQDYAGMKIINKIDIQLEFDKAKNPKKVVSLKAKGTMHVYYDDDLASIARMEWEVTNVPIGTQSTPNTFYGSEVCNYIKRISYSAESTMVEGSIELQNYSCDSSSQLWLTIKHL